MKLFWTLCLMVFLAISSCQTSLFPASVADRECVSQYDPDRDYFPHKTTLHHAQGFSVTYHKNYKVVTVEKPWKGSSQPLRYVLVQCGTPAPREYAKPIIIPLRSMVSLSTTHLTHFDILKVSSRLLGVSNTFQIHSTQIKQQIKQGKTIEIGSNNSLNREALIALQPDVVFTFSLGDPLLDDWQNLVNSGLSIVNVAEYREPSPLAQAEWLKFLALFFNQEQMAEQRFATVDQAYQNLVKLTQKLTDRPTVFTGYATQGTWYTPGGKSYVAQYLRDAGAKYLWEIEPSVDSIPLSFEQVYAEAAGADFWLNGNQEWRTRQDVLQDDRRYGQFKAFQRQAIYLNNLRLTPKGGNDYWESGIANPHHILADLITIFHPTIIPQHSLIYYQKIASP